MSRDLFGTGQSYRIVDLSITLKDDPSPLFDVKVTNLDHSHGAAIHQRVYDVDPQDWPHPGFSAGDDRVEASTHAVTHMDAPSHYGPAMIPGGEQPMTIDELPLEWGIGDGVVIDIRDLSDGYELSAAEVQERLERIGYALKPGDIVLLMTGNDKLWGKTEYLTTGGSVGRESLKWILDQGVKVVGTDAWSLDRPGKYWSADYHANGRDPKYLWPCHLLGLEIPYSQIEKMQNLDQLPAHGFTVISLPIKVSRGSAGFARAIALIPD